MEHGWALRSGTRICRKLRRVVKLYSRIVAAYFQKVMAAENQQTRSKAMEMVTLDTLCLLLKYVLQRMKFSDVRLL